MGLKQKLTDWKEAMKNTPADRLLRIKMQGYILQSIGIIVVSIFVLLYRRDFWWIIFIFIFSLWQNYSGFVSTWKQYQQLKDMKEKMNIGPEKEDKSPHRKKSKLIKEKLGVWSGWVTALASCSISYLVVPSWPWYLRGTSMLVLIILLYYLIYFVLLYKIAIWKYEK